MMLNFIFAILAAFAASAFPVSNTNIAIAGL
jgi:hypothetical protein